MMWREDVKKVLDSVAGQVVVYAKADGSKAVLRFVGGGRLTLELEGDCCSQSYFTKEAQFADLVGAKIIAVEEVEQPDDFVEYNTENTESLIWSFLKFTTDKGHFTVDWRNDSNGYYSGWLESKFEPGPGLPLADTIFCVGMDATSAAVWSDYCADHGVQGMEVEP